MPRAHDVHLPAFAMPESPKGACKIALFWVTRMSKPKNCGKYQARVFLDVFSLPENESRVNFPKKNLDPLLVNLSCFAVWSRETPRVHTTWESYLRLLPLEVVARARQEDQMLLDLWQSHGHPHYLIYRATCVWAPAPILLFP